MEVKVSQTVTMVLDNEEVKILLYCLQLVNRGAKALRTLESEIVGEDMVKAAAAFAVGLHDRLYGAVRLGG